MNNVLSCVRNYHGVLSLDSLEEIELSEFPAFFCVNLDYSYEIGSHWLSIRVSNSSLEIFDSLGLHFNRYPKPLYNFVSKYGKLKCVKLSPVLQPISSPLCGFYAIYFIITRQTRSFKSCLLPFVSDLQLNDRILLSNLTTILSKNK